jgi:hypothetical protein
MNISSLREHRYFFSIIIAIYLFALSGLFMQRAYDGLNGLTLKVRAVSKNLGTYNDQYLGGKNHFISGIEGELYWKPANLAESVLLITANNRSIDVLDIVALFITAGIVVVMFKGSNSSAYFTKNMASGFLLIIFTIAMMGMLLDIGRLYLANNYVPYITHGNFKGDYNHNALSYYLMVYPILAQLIQIPKKALQLQTEAELTI